MANSYNSNPILINTDMTSGWKASQTLNTSNQPATAQSIQWGRTATSQPGIRPFRIQMVSNGTTAASNIQIVDPNDSTLLWQQSVGVSAGASGTILFDEAIGDPLPQWRDFKVTGVTTGVVQIQIWYRT